MRSTLSWPQIVLPLLLILAAVCILPGPGVASDPAYNISIDGSYETPTDTVTFEGEQFTVNAVGTASKGEKITVVVDAPANAEYQINLYTLDQQIQDFRTATGPTTVTFDTSLVTPGSYVVAAVDNQDFFAVHPVVVTDYTLTTTVPDRVPTDRATDASITIEATPGENAVGSVELAVWNDTWRERIPLTERDNGRYTGSLPALTNGTYRVSGVVIAAERVDDEENVLAVSEPTPLVADPATTGSANDSTDNSTDGADSGSTGGEQADPPQDDSSSVISPNNETETADESGYGFGSPAALVGVVLFCAFGLRRVKLSVD